MSVSASIKFVQAGGGGTGEVGEALEGVVALAVVASNGNNANVKRWKFSWGDSPPASAFIDGVVQDGPLTSFTFTPDVPGGYSLDLTTFDEFGNSATDTRVFIIPEVNGGMIPPFTANVSSFNLLGTLKGWATVLRWWLNKIAPPAVEIAALNIDFSLGDVFYKDITVNSTFTFTNAYSGMSKSVRITAAAANTVTWPAAVQWVGTSEPVQTTPGKTVYTFMHDGTVVIGNYGLSVG